MWQEQECRKLHDKLETETIDASVLRYKLQIFPDEIKKQIQGAVNAARELNTTELTNLRTTLDTINSNIDSFESRHTVLEKDNAHLHPERSRVRQLHEEVIGHLNKRMSEKASKQIVLNETRDQLREINQKIEDLEEGILQLKEDLIQERADARQEKKRLKQVVNLRSLYREIDAIQMKVTQSEQNLEEMRKNIRQFEISKSRLESQEKLLTNQLQQEIINNDELRLRGIDLQQTIQDEKISFEEERNSLEEMCTQLDSEIDNQIEQNEYLEGEKEKADEGKIFNLIKIFKKKILSSWQQRLQAAKTELAKTAEDAANLRGENADMEARILELEETHDAILSTLNKQVEDLRETLSGERKERIALQAQRDDVQGDLESFRNEALEYQNRLTRQMKQDKKMHDDLTKEGAMLQQKIKESDRSIMDMEADLIRMKAEFEIIKEQYSRDFKGLEVAASQSGDIFEEMEICLGFRLEEIPDLHFLDIAIEHLENKGQEMNVELEEKKAAIDAQTPNFESLQVYFDERIIEYDATKRELIVMKNKKLSLEESLKRAQRDLEKKAIPRHILETDLKKRRAENLEKMKELAEEVKVVESEIYSLGCKYKVALEENNTFSQANDKLSKHIDVMNGLILSNEDAVKELLHQLAGMKDVLIKDWKADREMDEKFIERDQEVVDDFSHLLDKTENREKVISGITNKLQEELGSLAGFLDNLAQRRPPASSKMSMR
ncbi:hypothetical protein CAPTEDRAFT_215688 [Capitella teleta]|uniref:Uncharacterized protein n=1 Tax=Capitella teleta TaxID=283909 RepID=R7TJC0_CAPTE|nr:hypothetical protein CAPTEDRAFT_215688 [Capitella teleta]|eukprot:ELT93903.1 hypothetical protein CAPTEDRAFT_215688 [Capitella teleta]